MLKRWLVKALGPTLLEALESPICRITALESNLEDLERDWRVAADELDALYKRVHRELGHITKTKALDEKANDEVPAAIARGAMTAFTRSHRRFT